MTPHVVAGRDAIVAQVATALREGPGSPYRFTHIEGARGSGKTVLLNLLEDEARDAGWSVIRVPASKDMLDDLRDSELPHLLSDLREGSRREIIGGSIAGIGSITTTPTDSPVPTLRRLLHQTCEALDTHNSGLLLTMDELQSAAPDDVHLLTDAIQNAVRDGLPIALSVAGLPFEIAELLALPGTTFLRRAVPVSLEPLSDEDVATTLQETALQGGRRFDEVALYKSVSLTQGYPFLIQLIGSVAFAMSDEESISLGDVQRSEPLVIERIGLQVHQPAMRDVPGREMEYLQAMRTIGSPASTAEVAKTLNIPANQQTTYRRRLIERGLITPALYGYVRFALPYMEEYLATLA